jgi:hypothetical protein
MEVEMGFVLSFTLFVVIAYLVGFMAGLLLGVVWVLLVEGVRWISSTPRHHN